MSFFHLQKYVNGLFRENFCLFGMNNRYIDKITNVILRHFFLYKKENTFKKIRFICYNNDKLLINVFFTKTDIKTLKT